LPSEGDLPLVKRPIFWAGVVFAGFIVLQILFW
jgi:SSS family solute:Na+ symporter